MLAHHTFINLVKDCFLMKQSYGISENSKLSYNEFVKAGKLSKYKSLIVIALSKESASRRTLTKKVKAKHPSNLCAPLKDLENEGIICVIDTTLDSITSRLVSVYSLTEKGRQMVSPDDINKGNGTISSSEGGNASKNQGV